MMVGLRMAAVVGLLLLLALPALDAEPILPGNRFPVTERTLYLTSDTGSAGGQSGVRLLSEEGPGASGQVTYVLPGIDLLGIVQRPNAESWYTQTQWDKSLEVTEDSVATLYFAANAQALAIILVQLYDVAPDGRVTLIDSDEQQFITALSSRPVSFPLHTAGSVVQQGHVLRLEIVAQTASAAIVFQFGGTTPSALEGLRTRWLDTDGDGVPDSDEVALGRNPLDARDGVPDKAKDGDQDGLSDEVEGGLGTDPADADSDDDGYGDGIEVHAGSDPRNAASKPYDVNNNGLPDSFETNYFNSTTVTPTTGPCAPGPGCIDPLGDPDGDGCDNLCEAAHGTDPTDPDSDGDGVPDGKEIEDGSDPSSAQSFHSVRGVPEPVATAAAFAIGSTLCIVPLFRKP